MYTDGTEINGERQVSISGAPENVEYVMLVLKLKLVINLVSLPPEKQKC